MTEQGVVYGGGVGWGIALPYPTPTPPLPLPYPSPTPQWKFVGAISFIISVPALLISNWKEKAYFLQLRPSPG